MNWAKLLVSVRHVRSRKLLLCPNNKEKAEQTEKINNSLYIYKRSKVTGPTPVPNWERLTVEYRDGDFLKPKPTSTDQQGLGPARTPEL